MESVCIQNQYGRRLIPNLIDDFAENTPFRPFCSVPYSCNPKDGFRDVSFEEVAAAINKFAWWIESRFGKSQTFQPLAYIGPPDLRYALLTVAAQKTGHKAFFLSAFNNLEENISLYEVSESKTLLTITPTPHMVDRMSATKHMEVITVPDLNDLLDVTQRTEQYSYVKTVDQGLHEPFVALHTSGSTGPPKMIFLTHGTFAACDAYQNIPSFGRPVTCIESLRGKRVFSGMPPSHAAGLFILLAMPVFYDVIPVLGPPIPLTTNIIDEIHASGNLKASIVRASVLEDIADNPVYLENLTGLDCVLNGGSALSQLAGDQIAKKTSIISYAGSTETLLLPVEFPSRDDWQYCTFSRCMGAEFRHYHEDLYEMVIVRHAEYEKYQSIFATFPHLSEYSMQDLYSKHLSKPGLWRYEARCVDIIKFSDGKMLNVLPMERIITSYPEVSAALVMGQARMQTSLLVEASQPLSSDNDRIGLLERIWPHVECANQACDTNGRISRDHVIFSTPEKPMIRKKGRIDRAGTTKIYAQELEGLYTAFNSDAAVNNVTQPKGPALSGNLSIKGSTSRFHSVTVLSHWDQLLSMVCEENRTYAIDGESLDLATLVAVARHGVLIKLSEKIIGEVESCAAALETRLAEGRIIYGVNTGFGGSADASARNLDKLQATLIGFLNCGILPKPLSDQHEMNGTVVDQQRPNSTGGIFRLASLNEDPIASTTMLESWVRAALLVRSNSLSRENSGVRLVVIESLLELLQKNITPLIPLRGSISASGDLIPLSYIAAALQGSPHSQVWLEGKERNSRYRTSASEAISRFSLGSVRLHAKEGLAIINGPAVSAGIGALALHEAHCLAVLSQILTAMDVEAMLGPGESFDPCLALVKPHVGQADFSHNIRSFLAGSKLAIAKESDSADAPPLRQERYSIRTAAQWIGPQLENLMLAHEQLLVELNATTDNPIIDSKTRKAVQGGNFQAMAIISAMENVRSALEIIGRMLFEQCTELMNPAFNNGLPPNLTVNKPSGCFLMKGVDINIAALQAELGLLANPVTSHTQNAEMCDQSLNSLAFLSARYTHVALDILSQLSAACVLSLCQALDIRVLYIRFLQAVEPVLESMTKEILGPVLRDVDDIHSELWLRFQEQLKVSSKMDSSSRFKYIFDSIQPVILSHAYASLSNSSSLVSALWDWKDRTSTMCAKIFRTSHDAYLANPDPTEYLGLASKIMHNYVRQELQVPFQAEPFDSKITATPGSSEAGIGSLLSTIYSAIRNGNLYVPVMDCLRHVHGDAAAILPVTPKVRSDN